MNMTKKRVAELEGAQLNWAVAVSEGNEPAWFDMNPPKHTVRINGRADSYDPSGSWEQGGPIIEREEGSVSHWSKVERHAAWIADMGLDMRRYRCTGPTALIAAMRAFVASKLGDEVEVPE